MNKMKSFAPFTPLRTPTPNRPLLGMTVLVVEDSRFACEAMRLMCLRSGARIRRADCLRSARRHLQVYRPSAVIVDMGLPDGSGLDLIAELAAAQPRVGVIIGLSGDDGAEAAALAAGADAFIAKPFDNLGAFQQTIISVLPAEQQPAGPRTMPDDAVDPDPTAYRDDMNHVANLLETSQDSAVLDYVAQFLGGVARSADDTPLADAAVDLARTRPGKGERRAKAAALIRMVQDRLHNRVAI